MFPHRRQELSQSKTDSGSGITVFSTITGPITDSPSEITVQHHYWTENRLTERNNGVQHR